MVLECAAAEPATGARLLTDHRAGLELLRLALRGAASPWAHVLDSVSATLPALAGDERAAVARLAAQGPPEEQVGLDPYAAPELLPLLLGAFWPFTRLVHMLTAPLGYLTRPCIVCRSRDSRLGARAPHRGWERVR